jgi:chemotaxis signal transduction protein
MNERLTSPSSFFNGEHSQNLARLSNEEFWRYAGELAHLPPSSPSTSEYLKCTCAEGAYILPLTALREVAVLPRHFTLLPSSPVWMLGLTSWRNEIIAVLDLAAYLFRSPRQLAPTASLLIAQNDYATLGLSAVLLSSLPPPQADSVQRREHFPDEYTSLPSGIIGMYEGAFVLDIPSLLIAMVQEMTTAQADE